MGRFALQPFGRVDPFLGQNLDGHPPSCQHFGCFVHLSHAACGDAASEAITPARRTAESASGREFGNQAFHR